ncbi:MAG: hypothetical protein IKP89_01735 [Bacteroidales bacterium]|nr:hypothetical protein [Bacteroidales bacterium]
MKLDIWFQKRKSVSAKQAQIGGYLYLIFSYINIYKNKKNIAEEAKGMLFFTTFAN